jgi:hypothetical protein
MPVAKCPFDGCDYVTDDLEATIVVELIKAHTTAHTVGNVVTTKTPAEPKTSTDQVTLPTPTANVHSKHVILMSFLIPRCYLEFKNIYGLQTISGFYRDSKTALWK